MWQRNYLYVINTDTCNVRGHVNVAKELFICLKY